MQELAAGTEPLNSSTRGTKLLTRWPALLAANACLTISCFQHDLSCTSNAGSLARFACLCCTGALAQQLC